MNSDVTLKSLLQRIISDYNERIKSLKDKSSLIKTIDELESIKEDYYRIVGIDFNKIEDIINEFSYDEDYKKLIIAEMRVAQVLLDSNIKNNTNYILNDNHKQSINDFIRGLEDLRIRELQKDENESLELEDRLYNYNNMLNILEDDNNNRFIFDLDVINKIFDEYGIEEEERRDILIRVIKYNEKVYNRCLHMK